MKNNQLFEKALMRVKLKDYDEAEKIIKNLLEEDSRNVNYYITLGNIYYLKKDRKKALKAYLEGTKTAPENPDCYSNLGVIYRQMGKYTQAVNYFKKALAASEATGPRADIYYNLGNVYKNIEQSENAEKSFLKAIELDPSFIQAYNNLGNFFFKNKENEKAEEIIRKGLLIDENHPGLLYNLGLVLDAAGKTEEAIESYKHSLVGEPLGVESLNNLGIAYNKTNNIQKAVKTFNNALKIDPANYKVKNNMGFAYKADGKGKEARRYYKEAIKSNPEYTKASINLSELYLETGDLENAFDEISRIEAIKPEDADVKIQKANIYIEKGEIGRAEEIIDTVLKKKEDSPVPLALKALIKLKKGETEEAKKYIEKANSLTTDNLSLKMVKSEFLKNEKNFEDAEKELREIIFQRPGDYRASLELAKILKTQEKYDDALAVLNTIKGDYGDLKDTISEYSDTFKQSGQVELALEYSNRFLGTVGKEGSSVDISVLNQGIELFEQNAKIYEIQRGSKIEERINDFVRNYVKQGQKEVIPQDAMSFLIASVDNLADEEVPLLDMGVIEPVIEINEDVEVHFLKELEAEFDEEDGVGRVEELQEKRLKEEIEKQKAAGGQYPFGQMPYPYPPPPPVPKKKPPPLPPPAEKQTKSAIPSESTKEEKPKEKIGNMLDYLENLTSYLGDDKKKRYISSMMKLKVETLKRKLKGQSGFLNSIWEEKVEGSGEKIIHKERRKKSNRRAIDRSDLQVENQQDKTALQEKPSVPIKQISTEELESTFGYLKKLTEYLPENSGGIALSKKLTKLIELIKEEKENL